LSKIIKASHLVFVSTDETPQNISMNNNFTSKHSEMLYEEARDMVQELINDAKINAANLLAEAKKEAEVLKKKAELIIENSYLEAEKIKEKAFKEAFDEGKSAGWAEVNNLINEANEIIKGAYKEKEHILADTEKEIINLAIKVSEKIIRRQINLNKDTMQFIAKSLLELVQDSKQVTIKVNAEDYTNLDSCIQDLQALVSRGELKLEIDNTLKDGDCLIISETGIIVAKIDSQLEKIRNALMEANSNA